MRTLFAYLNMYVFRTRIDSLIHHVFLKHKQAILCQASLWCENTTGTGQGRACQRLCMSESHKKRFGSEKCRQKEGQDTTHRGSASLSF